MAQTDWQHQAKSNWDCGDYQSAANLYELAIELEPEVRSHYWNLGLMLLLLGEEEDAQATWLSVMLEAEPEAADEWTAELLRVLQREAERQETFQNEQKNEQKNEENDRLAWVIRQHIREIAPADLDNTLQLMQQFVRLDILEDFEEIVLEAIALLENTATPNRELCRQTVQTLLDVAAILPVTAQFTQACVARLKGDRDLENAIVNKTASLAKDSSFPKSRLIPYLDLCHQLQPENIPILVNLINLYQDENQYDRSLELTAKLLSQADTLLDRIAGYYLKIRALLKSGGDFDKAYTSHETYQSLLLELIDAIENQKIAVDENHLLNLISIVSFFGYLDDRPQEANQFRQKIARVWQSQIKQHFSLTSFDFTTFEPSRLKSDRPLKIGYLSGCLTRHSVGSISRWLFRHHDRDRFQTYGYSLTDTGDFIQQEIASQLSIFRNFSQDTPIPEIATQIERDKIDILVDLDSLTSKTGCAVLAIKPAPVQVTWLGFDASEIPTIDYFIADSYVLPDSAQTYYREKILRLPQTYLAVDGFEVGVPTLRREKLEIPSDAIVYFSSQTGAKRHPENVRSQMKILQAVPNSYLLIKGLNTDIESVRRFFEQMAAEEGVKCDRLRFLPAAPSEAIHRANIGIADVVLDTYPYNGTTTTLETLWMEVPVVTRVGEQFASRQGYTLLTNAGIEEGIAWTDEAYVEWGIQLGTNSQLRQQIAWKLRQSKKTAPLWNAQRFTCNLEQAYLDIWNIYIRQHS
ncbi:O-linked N-acetylglucosamine transferase, SPINDLY family protein [Oscillatoriales cyanobacterium LEGE 11467]|uniref:O-linked N-acetylglucosamine transferase, SPINDLY family protein n=1 Tax=Zarconia navalis LEGE 11467 TaxID=1828826 RepID=A0A928VX49_9CYAN|nr:O-linked N-acetylglucosamine transferase, SPINDLY family protein [Zarconia navalis]MBE9041847.1 O-linked N-acetylglucosamine transferase, SPINDLY family protein [Zarconia navalis LEGE 11467]